MENQEKENKELTKLETKKEKKPSWKFKAWFLIFIFAAVGFVFYQFSIQSSPSSSGEENQAGILDIFSSKGLGVGDLAPNFVAEDVYGNKVSLSDFQEKKPVLLVFWATWCGFCAKELPDLKTFTQEYQNEIQVIAVPSGESKETIESYLQEENINFLMLLDKDRGIWNQYLIRGTPSHFLIDKEGKIISLRPGLSLINDLEVMLTMLR